jgi:hypothetical protein
MRVREIVTSVAADGGQPGPDVVMFHPSRPFPAAWRQAAAYSAALGAREEAVFFMRHSQFEGITLKLRVQLLLWE